MSESELSAATLKIFCPGCRQKLDAGKLPAFTKVNCPVCGTAFPIPLPFDGYLLEEVIGKGGMATVYRALDTALNRTVAIKILDPGLGEDVNRRFLVEAKMAAKVAHPAVVAIYTCAVSGSSPYIVMEYMDGVTLETLLQENPLLDIIQVCEWVGNLAGGLERAQKNGIIHHDIKPANMLLNRDSQVKIGDFGIAGTLEQESGKNGGRVWGSPNYISPEKALTGVEDHTGDIYSLGASFYHLLTGRVPFPHTESLQELLTCRAHRDPVAPHLIREEIPEELSLFVLKMMHRVSGMRPSYSQIRLFLLDYVRKNSLKRARRSSGGAAFIPEREKNGADPGGIRSSSASSSREGENAGKESSGSIAEKEETPKRAAEASSSAALRLRFLTALGKLLLFVFFFLLVFGVSRMIMTNDTKEKPEVKEDKLAVTEEKK